MAADRAKEALEENGIKAKEKLGFKRSIK